MRIAIFTDTYLPDINGVATSTQILFHELIKHNHEVLIVTTELPSNTKYDDEGYVIRVKGLDLKKVYGYRMASIYSFSNFDKIKQFSPEVIHIQTEFGVGIFGKIVGEKLKVPVCYTYHTMWADYSHYLSKGVKPIDIVMKKIIEKISKFYGNTCQSLIVPSQKTADILLSYGIKQDIHVIPTGLELDKFNKKYINQNDIDNLKKKYHLEDSYVILFLGRIAPEKSIDFLIESFKDILIKIPHAKLLIVGGGPDLDNYKRLAEKENISSSVIFTGAKSPKEVPLYYHLSDVFVSASITETQGLTYIEAMATSLPVIARYDKNLEDVIIDGYNGYFFKTKEEFINNIHKLYLSNNVLFKENALKTSEKYSSEVFYNKITQVYEKVINDGI